MRKIDVIMENSNGCILMVETAVVFEGDDDESSAIQLTVERMFADGLTLLPGDTLRFVERD